MAKQRLNDTRAVVDMSTNGGGASHSISSEKIENGWLIRQSSSDPRTGEYRCSTSFSANQPRLIPGRAVRNGMGGNGGLKDTMDYLKAGD